MGRWGDREMGEIFIKGNCHKMILAFYCQMKFIFIRLPTSLF
ncbi:hypothetical protein [Moorena producens]